MKFSDSVVMFDYAKFPILGKFGNWGSDRIRFLPKSVFADDAFEAGSKELSTDDFSPEFCSALSEGKFFREEHDGNLVKICISSCDTKMQFELRRVLFREFET